ncbi:MAG: tetratricopeptide (TPR) repeat protein, partial [Myxococcota bacterium]
MRNAILLTAICTVLVTAPTTAEATSPRQLAAQHTTRGDAARAGQRYAEAVSEYVLAYAYDPAPERLLNLARTYEAMGNRTVALELYRRTAQVARSGPAADDANRRIVALGGAAAGAGAIGAGGSVSVMTIPPGGEIWIDGQKKGNSPMAPVTVAAGQHRLEVRLNGYKTYAKTINVVSAGKINEMVSLQPGVSGPAPAPAAAAPMTLTVHSVPAGAQVLL